ncbi:MAG: LacI family DNA-binding transcriptional regulator [Anaerobacillus sp.]|uniref:LacI family DNA-binding transcriptional regulator n=1 Tax=Anaerobacillus sp. TaxID=1872506 RepID=UPI00391BA158
MSITIKDIAKQAGVSYSTVSKALRNSPLVKDPTKKKVLAIAEQLGYIPNIAARSLVQKKSYTIGVVWPSLQRVAPSALITNINELLEKETYTTLLSINSIESAVATFNRFQVDAIIVFGETNGQNKGNTIQSKVPILYYGIKDQIKHPTIDVNRRFAIKFAVDHLNQLGHKKIAFIGEVTSKDLLQKEKYYGYLEGMASNYLTVKPQHVSDTKGLDVYSGYLSAKSLFTDAPDVTAIISGSYDLTRGIIRAAQEKNLNIPNNLSIISYDNVPQQSNPDNAFTKIGVPIERIAEEITRTLLAIIDKKEVADSIVLTPELNEGNSCKKI